MATGRSSSQRKLPHTAADLFAAVERGDVQAARSHLDNGADSNGSGSSSSGGSEGRPTLLQIAAGRGDAEMVKLLIEHNCWVNTQLPETGDSALMMALDGGHRSAAEQLIRHEKCDYNAQNNAGYTALMKAVKAGLIDTAELLLGYCSPDLECKTVGDGYTALSLAVTAANPEAVQLLMEFGADAKNATGSGKTPVDLAWGLPETPEKRRICESLMQRKRGQGRAGLSSSDGGLIGRRYKRLSLLGDGAHGQALLVRDMRGDCDPAGSRLKVLKRIVHNVGNRKADREVVGMQEVNVLKQLDHSCVLTILDYFTDGGTSYIVTEYCELRDMQTWIQWAANNDLALPPHLVVHWFLQMLLGLSYLHSRRVIHRDLKPSNVFVKLDATVRLGDFGCSKQLLNSRDCAMTVSGTWIYMSPEVLQNDKYGTECDMWSLGCTLYELCTGQPLFDPSLTRAQLKEQICHGQLPELASNLKLPEWLPDAFTRLMVREPTSRRPSAAALLSSLALRQTLKAMGPEMLAVDRDFLCDARANVVGSGDNDEEARDGGRRAYYTEKAYKELLADAQRALEAPPMPDHSVAELLSDGAEAGIMSELEKLRSQLAEKQREGFPLEKVHKLILEAQSSDLSQANKQRLLAKVTGDTDACEMVEMAIALEQCCLADDSLMPI